MANEAKLPSGTELKYKLITGSATKAAFLHFNKKSLINTPEVLNLYNISSALPLRQQIADTDKGIVAKMANGDHCREIKCAVINLMNEV